MDPILTPIMIILGKYALDKGVELGKEVGPKALETAKEIYGMTLDYLGRRDTEGEVFAKRFEERPDKYGEEVEEMLAESLESDPDFATRLKDMLARYETQAQEYAATTGASYQATVTDTGSVAQGTGATATTATDGGIAIGSVGGDVTIGDKGQEQ